MENWKTVNPTHLPAARWNHGFGYVIFANLAGAMFLYGIQMVVALYLHSNEVIVTSLVPAIFLAFAIFYAFLMKDVKSKTVGKLYIRTQFVLAFVVSYAVMLIAALVGTSFLLS